jgi:hypothetical protein
VIFGCDLHAPGQSQNESKDTTHWSENVHCAPVGGALGNQRCRPCRLSRATPSDRSAAIARVCR